jgi:hypothetical protein
MRVEIYHYMPVTFSTLVYQSHLHSSITPLPYYWCKECPIKTGKLLLKLIMTILVSYCSTVLNKEAQEYCYSLTCGGRNIAALPRLRITSRTSVDEMVE